MVKFSRRQARLATVAANEYSESNFIPYYCHWDGSTIVTKKDELIQIIKIEGFSFETADDEDVDAAKHLRNSLIRSIGQGNFALWFNLIRRKQIAHIDGNPPKGFASYVHEEWSKKHEAKETYRNDIYISVIFKPDTKGAAALEHLATKIQHKSDKTAYNNFMTEAHKDITDFTKRLVATFRDYRPHVLDIVETPDGGHYSEPMEFLSTIVNGGKGSRMLAPSLDISKYLPTHRLYFGPRAIEVRGPTSSHFCGLVSIQEYPPSTNAGMMDAFLQLPMELIISQSFTFTNKSASIGQMKLQQRRMVASGDVAVSQTAEISSALDLAMSGAIGFGHHHITILCMEPTLRKLEDSLSLVYSELINFGSKPVRERINMQAAYWAQLPANFGYVARKSIIHTLNLSAFASLHNYPVGKRKGNHWGDAVTVFDTTSGTPYYFNFHARDVGHTVIIGPTGSGKTVLMNFLCAQAQKFNGRMFFFDKDRGAEIFIRAIGGNYTIIEPGKDCFFNPLQLEETAENRSFLVDWLSALITTHTKEMRPEDIDIINEAIKGNYKMPKEKRLLRNLAAFFGLEGPGSIAGRLKMWHSGESHARLFDNTEDRVDFSKSRVFGFEMGEVLKDKVSLGPVLLYLFHKISQSLDGTPTMVVLDEAWALIDNPVFAPKIKDWLKTMRKLNAMVVFATQSVEDASKSGISDTLIQQTATQLFLPNPKATEEYRKVFMLTQREFTLIKTTHPSTRYFLVKQGSEVVVARIDLSGMTDVINVLSGRAETVRILDEIRNEVGENPDDWLPIFYQRVKSA